MKKESNKGITLLTLAVTIAIMLILSFTVSINVSSYVQIKKRTNFEADITKLQEEISIYYNKNNTLPIANKYININEFEKNVNDGENFYVIDLSKLNNISLNYGKDYEKISDFTQEIQNLVDIYIINEQSHTIYYPKGIEHNGRKYYTIANKNATEIEDMKISEIKIEGLNEGIVNTQIKLIAKTIPEFVENTGVSWYSSDENIATVDESGRVTLNNIGEVIITAMSKDNNDISTTHKIQIAPKITNFDYTSNVQEYIAPVTGTYKIECWGAQGGNINLYTGGKGAYTSGTIELTKGTILYIYVGGQSNDANIGGYNGGGSGKTSYGASGGGATDIRINNGEWNDMQGLVSRIMVAGGGGSAENRGEGYGEGKGGYAGGLIGGTGEITNVTIEWGQFTGNGGTQTLGGTTNSINNIANSIEYKNGSGNFGTGGTNLNAGGGGGYYGGGASYHGAAGGGSSFVSGFEGCDAVDSEGNHTGQAYHYSSYVFKNIQMKAGNELIPNKENGEQIEGNSGNGFARISFNNYFE